MIHDVAPYVLFLNNPWEPIAFLPAAKGFVNQASDAKCYALAALQPG